MLDNLVSYGVCRFGRGSVGYLISDPAAAIGLGTGFLGPVGDVIKQSSVCVSKSLGLLLDLLGFSGMHIHSMHGELSRF